MHSKQVDPAWCRYSAYAQSHCSSSLNAAKKTEKCIGKGLPLSIDSCLNSQHFPREYRSRQSPETGPQKLLITVFQRHTLRNSLPRTDSCSLTASAKYCCLIGSRRWLQWNSLFWNFGQLIHEYPHKTGTLHEAALTGHAGEVINGPKISPCLLSSCEIGAGGVHAGPTQTDLSATLLKFQLQPPQPVHPTQGRRSAHHWFCGNRLLYRLSLHCGKR